MNKKQDLLDMELEEAETRRDSFLILNFYHYNGMATKHRGSFPKFSVGKFVTRSYKEIFSEISIYTGIQAIWLVSSGRCLLSANKNSEIAA